MRYLRLLSLLLGAVTASPYTKQHLTGTSKRQSSGTREPCAVVSSQAASSLDGRVDALVAYQCLQSVPVQTKEAVDQIAGILTISEFQSTLAYLKDPPPGYLYPAVDVQSKLQNISDSVQKGLYTSEYDLQFDISSLIYSAHDGHYSFRAEILSLISFLRADSLYSVSTDGVSLPEIYCTEEDVHALSGLNGTTYTPSAVSTINGQDVEEFINAIATANNGQDPDGNYNTVFPIYNCADDIANCGNLFTGDGSYLGAETIVEFKNGSTRRVDTYASVNVDFTGVTDGKSLFTKFCMNDILASITASSVAATATSFPIYSSTAPPVVSISGSAAASSIKYTPTLSTPVIYSAVASQTVIPAPSTFPEPWRISSDKNVACYFPQELEDTMVFAIPSFESDSAAAIEFQNTVRQCLATASKMGKEKLVVDLRGNGGGTAMLGFDLFKQLFPDGTPVDIGNLRASDLLNDLGQTVTNYFASNGTSGVTPLEQLLESHVVGTFFDVDSQVTVRLDDFDSWTDFYGPLHIHNDIFTNLFRINLSDTEQTSPIQISGYVNLTDITPKQTFAAENIVLLQDGYCASTCAIYTEFMKSANVGQVAVGGRKQTGPMQGVGGVKGSRIYPATLLAEEMLFATEQDPALNSKWGTSMEQVHVALNRGPDASVNVMNTIRNGDTTSTPLQFVYEATNCRIFYTAPMFQDQTVLWKAAHDSYWKDGGCVEGSTNQWSSAPGIGYILEAPGAKKPASNSTSTSPSASASAPIATVTGNSAAGVVEIQNAVVLLSGLAAALMLW